MAYAAYRIYRYAKEVESTFSESSEQIIATPTLKPLEESNTAFVSDMFLKSLVVAFAVKYGELLIDLPFNPTGMAAASIIALPTALNIAKWAQRSQADKASASLF